MGRPRTGLPVAVVDLFLPNALHLILARNSCGRKFQLELSQYLELEILSPF